MKHKQKGLFSYSVRRKKKPKKKKTKKQKIKNKSVITTSITSYHLLQILIVKRKKIDFHDRQPKSLERQNIWFYRSRSMDQSNHT